MQGQFVGQDTQPFQDDSGRRYVVQAAWFAVCLAFWKRVSQTLISAAVIVR
jgi:hypothetical protein